MRKITLLIISSLLALGLITGCSTTKEKKNLTDKEQISTSTKEQDIREIAYNKLTSKDRERISGTWRDSSLSKIILKEEVMRDINDKSYISKEVYLIDFTTKEIRRPNNMIVYLSIDTHKFLGYGVVD